MSRSRWIPVLAALLMAPAMPAAAQAVPDSFAPLADRLMPAVVNISTRQSVARGGGPDFQFPPGSPFEDFFKDFQERQGPGGEPAPGRRATALGSGFIIDPSGYVVTNHHVIAGADEISVSLHDDTTFDAEVIGHDEKTDLALLKVESDKPLPYVSWGDSDAVKVGDWILAIGNPFGLGGTVTAGIVSARARDINAGPYDDFIQTDASINQGNSGGPMFDLEGQVIGVNTAIFSPSGGSVGIGFAVPANMANHVIRQLREYGRTRRGWLGVHIQQVTDEIAQSLDLPEAKGALVANVPADGPAGAAGIRPGDVILEFNGKPVPEMRRLPRMVAETEIGKAVPVVVWRDGESQTLEVTIGEMAEDQTAAAAPTLGESPDGGAVVESLGLRLATITPRLRQEYGLAEDVEGVVITGIEPDSDADRKGLRPGDLVIEVNQDAVTSPRGVAEAVETARAEGRKAVLLLIQRDGDGRFIALKINGG